MFVSCLLACCLLVICLFGLLDSLCLCLCGLLGFGYAVVRLLIVIALMLCSC